MSDTEEFGGSRSHEELYIDFADARLGRPPRLAALLAYDRLVNSDYPLDVECFKFVCFI